MVNNNNIKKKEQQNLILETNLLGLVGSIRYFVSDFVGVYAGLKPAMSGVISENEINDVNNICHKNGLVVEYADFKMLLNPGSNHKIVIPLNDPRAGRIQIFISKNKKLAQEARNNYKEHMIVDGKIETVKREVIIKCGKTLGYPDCCVNNLVDSDYSITQTNAVYEARIRTKRYHFELNNLAFNFYFVPYFVCSFDCKQSLIYAKKLLKVINTLDSKFCKGITSYLKQPLLFIGYNVGIIFKGFFIDDQTVQYNGFDFIGPVDEKIKFFLQKGNKCRAIEDRLEVYGDNILKEKIQKENDKNLFFVKFE